MRSNLTRLSIVVGLCLLLPFLAAAQTLQVKGDVVDEQGEPLVGCMIKVKGTQKGTMTDIEGKFEIPEVKKMQQ